LYKIGELSGGGERWPAASSVDRYLPVVTDLLERVLLSVVEEMAIASGTQSLLFV
jgi:hypothetical protein